MKIPDSVMGITFLAAGTSVPEAVSSVIVAKQGMHHFHVYSHILWPLTATMLPFRPWFDGNKQFNWLEYIRYIVVSRFAVAD